MATIGFIGLGNMGAPIAANLIGAGHRVTGFDLVPRAMEALATKGGHAPHRLPRPPPRATS
jgi:3-hydroxyisobutyrate dehydrogenase